MATLSTCQMELVALDGFLVLSQLEFVALDVNLVKSLLVKQLELISHFVFRAWFLLGCLGSQQYLMDVLTLFAIDNLQTPCVLECGGDVNVRGSSGATLLHRTVVGSTDERLLSLLCDSGADYNAVDRSGVTPLTAVCSQLGHGQWLECDHSGCDHSERYRRHVHYMLSLKDIKVGRLTCQFLLCLSRAKMWTGKN